MNEALNTARAIMEQKPLVKSIWCYFNIHNYTVWDSPVKDSVYGHVQTRTCANCNALKIRRVSASF